MNRHITKIIETETGHRLTSYPHKCAHLHGHRYRWEVSITAEELDAVGFIMDYGDLKEILKTTVDEIDHAFLFHSEDPLVKSLGRDATLLDATNGDKGRIFILPFNPTTENLVEWMADRILTSLPEEVYLTHIRVWETSGSYCDFWP